MHTCKIKMLGDDSNHTYMVANSLYNSMLFNVPVPVTKVLEVEGLLERILVVHLFRELRGGASSFLAEHSTRNKNEWGCGAASSCWAVLWGVAVELIGSIACLTYSQCGTSQSRKCGIWQKQACLEAGI